MVSIVVYVLLIRPVRTVMTANIYKPLINKMGIAVMELNEGDTEIFAKYEDIRIPLQMPFGAYFWPPAVLLFLSKSFEQLKIFSKYHLIIILIIPFILLMPVLNNVWNILPVKTFLFLSEFLGLVFIVIGLYNISMFIKNDEVIQL